MLPHIMQINPRSHGMVADLLMVPSTTCQSPWHDRTHAPQHPLASSEGSGHPAKQLYVYLDTHGKGPASISHLQALPDITLRAPDCQMATPATASARPIWRHLSNLMLALWPNMAQYPKCLHDLRRRDGPAGAQLRHRS